MAFGIQGMAMIVLQMLLIDLRMEVFGTRRYTSYTLLSHIKRKRGNRAHGCLPGYENGQENRGCLHSLVAKSASFWVVVYRKSSKKYTTYQ
jgi:hypothetical protein